MSGVKAAGRDPMSGFMRHSSSCCRIRKVLPVTSNETWHGLKRRCSFTVRCPFWVIADCSFPLICRCIYSTVTGDVSPPMFQQCDVSAPRSVLREPALCPGHWARLHENSWQEKDYRHKFLVLRAAQVTMESHTKGTMPPEWIQPTESFTFEGFEHKMELAWQSRDLGGETSYKESLFAVATFPYLLTTQSASWWL